LILSHPVHPEESGSLTPQDDRLPERESNGVEGLAPYIPTVPCERSERSERRQLLFPQITILVSGINDSEQLPDSSFGPLDLSENRLWVLSRYQCCIPNEWGIGCSVPGYFTCIGPSIGSLAEAALTNALCQPMALGQPPFTRGCLFGTVISEISKWQPFQFINLCPGRIQLTRCSQGANIRDNEAARMPRMATTIKSSMVVRHFAATRCQPKVNSSILLSP